MPKDQTIGPRIEAAARSLLDLSGHFKRADHVGEERPSLDISYQLPFQFALAAAYLRKAARHTSEIPEISLSLVETSLSVSEEYLTYALETADRLSKPESDDIKADWLSIWDETLVTMETLVQAAYLATDGECPPPFPLTLNPEIPAPAPTPG